MAAHAVSDALAARITRFARVLRAGGLQLGPGRILDGFAALQVIDITRRDDFYWSLHASWVTRTDEREFFDVAFRLFWRDPDRPVSRVLDDLLAAVRQTPARSRPLAHRRALEALDHEVPAASRESRLELETVRLAHSPNETLRTRDFEQMSATELDEAMRAVRRMRLEVAPRISRRWRSDSRTGFVDPRRTLRAMLRTGGAHIPLQWRRRRVQAPALVILCDVSGSMAGYTRILLHFIHTLTTARDRVHTFLFGTRLTNATRWLMHRDPDEALAHLGRRVLDWDGGTRIGPAIRAFNLLWARRVLPPAAIVLLITDGLDRDAPELLDREMARLHRSARRVIWLNPLLRYDAFQPEARGIKAMLPHVDELRPVHNLVSLESLADALSSGLSAGESTATPGRRTPTDRVDVGRRS
ncbi:MAG: VWA domain-containing protein [Gemmatimonadetes bacterium]|nr:VWA domain-containing protein [Gemmatimonadota bacterium]